MHDLKAALETLRLAILAYEHPEQEVEVLQAAREVQYAMNTALEGNVVAFRGIVRLPDDKAGVLMQIHASAPVLATLTKAM